MTESEVQGRLLDKLIAESKDRLGVLREKTAVENRLLEVLEEEKRRLAPPVASPVLPPPSADDGGDRQIEPGKLPGHIIAVLTEAGGPLQLKDLAERVALRGVTTTAIKGLPAVVASALTRRGDLFVRLQKGVFDLKERHSSQVNGNGG